MDWRVCHNLFISCSVCLCSIISTEKVIRGNTSRFERQAEKCMNCGAKSYPSLPGSFMKS